MANSLTQNPLRIDTAATIAFTRPVLAKMIEWSGIGAALSSVTIADLGGNVILQAVSGTNTSNMTIWQGPTRLTLPGKQASFAGSGLPNGSWQVSTITSGVLWIWF